MLSYKNIGVFCNWYQVSYSDDEKLYFQPLDVFTPGYLSLEFFYRHLPDSLLVDETDYSFALRIDNICRFVDELMSLFSPDLSLEAN